MRKGSSRGPDPNAVREMFSDIASKYDFLNHFLSLSIDRNWRRETVDLVGSFNPNDSDLCLDLCSGTGDLSIELHERLNFCVISADFCHPMLAESRKKLLDTDINNFVHLVEADTLELPFVTDKFSFVTIAFGLRNLEDIERGLREIWRVLKPNGALVVLEFSRPIWPVFREVFTFYFRHVLPKLGTIVSGKDGPYQYLPASVMQFPPQKELAALMGSVGFLDVQFRNLTGGVAALHWGRKTCFKG